MRKISEASLAKRISYAEKRIQSQSNTWFFPEDSDRQLLRRQQKAQYSLLIFILWQQFSWGIGALVRMPRDFGFESWVSLALILWAFQIGYSLYRTEWIIEAFDQFGPQSIADLKREASGRSATPDASPAPAEA